MKTKITILLFIVGFTSFGQENKFKIDCGIPIDVVYRSENDNTFLLEFTWEATKNINMNTPAVSSRILDGNVISRAKLVEYISKENGVVISDSDLLSYKFTDTVKQNVSYVIERKYTKNNILDVNNSFVLSDIYNSLTNKTINDGIVLCGSPAFDAEIVKKVTKLKDDIVKNITGSNVFTNKNITPEKTYVIQDDIDYGNKYWIYEDIRNPIAFTDFIIRNPRTNGVDKLSGPSNLSSYHYIKPGSIVNILFNNQIYKQLPNQAKLAISAYLKRKDGTVVPVTVSGFYEVKTTTNQSEYERNITLINRKNINGLTEDTKINKMNYNFDITSFENYPIQTEVNTSIINPQPEDKLIITITNVSDGNVSFTTTFEFEDYGWVTEPSGGFSWVRTRHQGDSNYKPAGSSGVSFYYKFDRGEKFYAKLLVPSFGPELIVLQDANQNTNVGLGLSVSTLLRSLKVGYGWYLVGEGGKPYFSIGVNFVEGYKSISSVLNRSKE